MPWSARAVALADIVFVNAGEARALTGSGGASAVSALRRAGPRHAVLTRGADGALLGRPDGAGGETIESVAAVPAAPVDTTGAGDTFLAVALASMRRRGAELDARGAPRRRGGGGADGRPARHARRVPLDERARGAVRRREPRRVRSGAGRALSRRTGPGLGMALGQCHEAARTAHVASWRVSQPSTLRHSRA